MANVSLPEIDADLIAFAEKLADAGRQVGLSYFRTAFDIEDKSDESPVTIADRNAEKAMRALIAEHFPDHGIIGEEFDTTNPESDLAWVLDPIDGTGSFIVGMPLYGVLVALSHKGRPLLGVVDAPALNERWVGAAGKPTLFNGTPCKTGGTHILSEATMHSTSPDMFTDVRNDQFARICRATKRQRYGGDCYQYGLLALGGVDLVVECGMKPHDFMALAPVVEGAGGVISNWRGEPLTLESGEDILAAANAELHRQAVDTLNS